MPHYKQVILVRQDLQLPKGKACAQAAHASVEAVLKTLNTHPEMVEAWREQGMAKITLKVKDEAHLVKLFQAAKDKRLIAALITDAGKTVVAPGTKTCAAIGPDEEEKIDLITKDLPLL